MPVEKKAGRRGWAWTGGSERPDPGSSGVEEAMWSGDVERRSGGRLERRVEGLSEERSAGMRGWRADGRTAGQHGLSSTLVSHLIWLARMISTGRPPEDLTQAAVSRRKRSKEGSRWASLRERRGPG